MLTLANDVATSTQPPVVCLVSRHIGRLHIDISNMQMWEPSALHFLTLLAYGASARFQLGLSFEPCVESHDFRLDLDFQLASETYVCTDPSYKPHVLVDLPNSFALPYSTVRLDTASKHTDAGSKLISF